MPGRAVWCPRLEHGRFRWQHVELNSTSEHDSLTATLTLTLRQRLAVYPSQGVGGGGGWWWCLMPCALVLVGMWQSVQAGAALTWQGPMAGWEGLMRA